MNVTGASTKPRPSSMTDQNDSDRGKGVFFPGGKEYLLQSLRMLLQCPARNEDYGACNKGRKHDLWSRGKE